MTPQLAPEIPEVEQPEELATQEYGEGNRDLPQQLQDALAAIIREFQQQEMYSRRREVLHDRLMRFYERGYQHITWSNQQGGYTQLTPGQTVNNAAGESIQCPSYIDDYNIFFANAETLYASLTQSAPGVNFQPIDGSNPDDIDKAKAAEDYSRAFDRMNDRPMLQLDVVRMMALSGRTVAWTRTVEDGQRFGYELDGTPKRFECTDVYGTLETKVPLMAPDLNLSAPYCFIFEDKDIYVLKADFPDIREKIKANVGTLGEQAYERTARLGILNGTRIQAQVGDSMSHMGTIGHFFLRPAAFESAICDNLFTEGGENDFNDDGSGFTVRDKLQQMFPDGCRAVFIGDQYARCYAECVDDHVTIKWPFPGDGMFRMAFMDPMVVIQDAFNDVMNGSREHFDTGWGSIWINCEDEEYDAITSQRAAPNAVRQFKLKTGAQIQHNVFQETMQNLPEAFIQYVENIQGPLPQFILATPPALFGASMEDQKTASGYAQARSQAMGRLIVIWSQIQAMFAGIRKQSVLCAAMDESRVGKMIIPAQGDDDQAIEVNLDALRKGDFGCYPDEDASFPETTQQKRAIMQELLTASATNPMIAQLFNNPDNIDQLKKLNGFDELTLIPAEARDKQLAEIEELLQGAPIPPSPQELLALQQQHAAGVLVARASGGAEPPPPDPDALLKPSVPVEELDYHLFEFEKCQEWLSTAARRQQDKKGNQMGVMNVKLHALEHKKMIMAMMPPPAPPVHVGKPQIAAPAPPPTAPAVPGAPPS